MPLAILPPEFYENVRLQCEAEVGGERLTVQTEVSAVAYDQSADLRDMIHARLRESLMLKILEKWTPVIEVTRP